MGTKNNMKFSVEDYAKVAATLWAIQAKHGNDYAVRITRSVLKVLTEAEKEKLHAIETRE
jgi:hypothetical protein